MIARSVQAAGKGAVLSVLKRIARGSLTVTFPGGRRHIAGHEAGPKAAIDVRDDRFFSRGLLSGEIGLGESYMAGEWESPDLVALIQLMLVNRDMLGAMPAAVTWPSRVIDSASHWWRRNTRSGSRRNIHAHYDLGNEFFELFLDRSLMYSCALFDAPDATLEQAQVRKLHAICERLQLGPSDHVLEIGTGWGTFALFAVRHYGCRVTTTTISRQQHEYAKAQFANAALSPDRIDLRLDDYRDLTGHYDKIVSIEMFEAVGLEHYDDFFATCDRLLARHGTMLMQTITVDDWRFDDYRRTPSWIAKHIFPGSELASVARILDSLARVTELGLAGITHIGPHYTPTLREWRRRFLASRPQVTALGFDDRFIRMWDLYLAYCEAAFMAGHIGDVQLLLAKPAAIRQMAAPSAAIKEFACASF